MTSVMSCGDRRVYHHYEHTPLWGWEKLDTLKYEVPPVKTTGNYALQTGVRINSTYPYMSMTMVVEQTLHRKGKKAETNTQRINCKLIDANGKAYGKGSSNWQYQYDIKTLPLEEGDSLSFRIRHDMKREMLPGVSDVGIALVKLPD